MALYEISMKECGMAYSVAIQHIKGKELVVP